MSTMNATSPEAASDFAEAAAEVDRRMQDLQRAPEAERQRAFDLKSAIEDFHRGGLRRIVERLREDERGRELLSELAQDPQVYALFSMHGLVRRDVASQVAAALEEARPYLQSHGGDVELVDVREGKVEVRLVGACHGCSMSSATLRQSVEETIRTRVPEIRRVEDVSGEARPAIVPLSALRSRKEDKGWVRGPDAETLGDCEIHTFEADGTSVLLFRQGDSVQAYRNACPHMGKPLDRAVYDRERKAIVCPWHGFEFDGLSGECLSAPQAQLEPFPLRVEDGAIWVRPQ